MTDDPAAKTLLVAIAAAAGLLLIAIGLPLLVLAVQPAAATCGSGSGPVGTLAELTAEQSTNAAIIVGVAADAGLPARAAVIAVATALQESALLNLDYGDEAGPDSRGLFQQRLQFYRDIDPLIPAQAAGAFLKQLIAVPHWDTMALADAAQAVQRSAHPALYAGRETQAQRIVDQLWAGPRSPIAACGASTGPVFILGDSITVRATPALTAALTGRGVTIDAAIGRPLTDGLTVLTSRPAELVGVTLVVALCTNYSGDQDTFRALIDQTMTLAAGAAAVEWVTCTEWSPAQTAANAAILDAVTRYPTITVADWAAPSRAPGLLDPDGVHPTLAAGVDAWTQIVVGHLPRLGPPVTDGYALPLDLHWYQEHPGWFTKPHHDGRAAIDIPVPAGTTVYAATAGTVISSPTGGDCGQGLVVDGDDGHRYTYCHGERPLIPVGGHVQVADPIMISGNTGRSDGAHLHFQITDPDGRGRCPQPALRAWATGHTIAVDALPTTRCGG